MNPIAPLLDAQQMRFWKENSYLLFRGFLNENEQGLLKRWTEELAAWAETPGKWMKYFEKGSVGRQLCRVENFIPYHSGLAEFLNDPRKLAILSQLMGEPAVLFKEKINFKLAGGKGFTPHQDAPAFTTFGQNYHITMMVSVDPSTIENGCLDVVADYATSTEVLQQEADGTLSQALVKKLRWQALPMSPGDLLLFDSYVPHGSAPNRTDHPRRALYVTYNRQSEGSRRAEYFEHKRAHFPPECERIAGVDYSKGGGVYNLGNPID